MKILLLITAVFCAVQALERDYNPGLLLSIHNELMVQSKLAYGTFLQRALNDADLWDVDIPDPRNTSEYIGKMTGCRYTIGNITYDMISIMISPETNSVFYKLEGGMAKFHCEHFDVKLNFLVKASGTLDLVDYNAAISAGLTFDTIMSQDGSDRQLVNGTFLNVTTWLDPKRVDFTINGTAITKALESLLPVLKYAIKGPLEKLISNQVVIFGTPEMNNNFFQKGFGIRRPIQEYMFDHITFDFSVPYPPKVGEQYSYAGFSGYTSFFDAGNPYDPTGFERAQFPTWIEEETPRVQGFLGEYFIQNFANTFIEANPGLGFIIDNTTLGSPFDLETLNYALPGLLKHYGNVNKECIANVTVVSVTDFVVYPEQGVVGVKADADCTLYVKGQNLDHTDQMFLKFKLVNLRANLTLDIGLESQIDPLVVLDRVTIFPQINTTTVEWLTTTYSLIGPVNELLFTEVFNMLMQPMGDLYPLTNIEAQTSIVLSVPNLFWGVFSIRDLTVSYQKGYLMLGATPVFRIH